MALDARAGGQYERFHDLAWRTVQTGPANDPALMYLVARAQSLSGRPRDALVMLRRLADRGVATGATTEEDFEGVRQLPGWQELEALMERVAKGGAFAWPQRSPGPAPDRCRHVPAAPRSPGGAERAQVRTAPRRRGRAFLGRTVCRRSASRTTRCPAGFCSATCSAAG